MSNESDTKVWPHEVARWGGQWLGAARTWLQSNLPNGDLLTWGSGNVLTMTVAQFEDAAAHIAAAAINEFSKGLLSKPTCGWGGNYGRCILEPEHDGPHELKK